MTRPARVVLDAAALTHNFSVVRRCAPGAHIYAVVKANAYGHGAPWVAGVLSEAGSDGFAVACLEEAVALREAGIAARVLLLEGCVDDAELRSACALGLDTVVHCEAQLRALLAGGRVPGRALWLKVDSGMGRLGMDGAAARAAWGPLRALLGTDQSLGLMTHLACGDEPLDSYTDVQLGRFDALARALQAPLCTAANSAAVLAAPAAHGHWVRPGLMLYGASPLQGRSAAALGLRPVATFQSDIIAVKCLPAGAPVGYGRSAVTQRPTRLGIVAAGYADGYPRHVAAGTTVLLRGQRVALLGRVSMDMLAIDLTDCAAATHGDTVTLWGGGLPVEEVAAAAGTIAYDLLCRPAARVRRVVQGG